jgi:hypothetical protein
MLVLVIKMVYGICRSDGVMWNDMYTKFHQDWFTRVQAILMFLLRNLRGHDVRITDGRNDMMHSVEIPSCGMIFLSSLMKIGTGVRAVLRVSSGI